MAWSPQSSHLWTPSHQNQWALLTSLNWCLSSIQQLLLLKCSLSLVFLRQLSQSSPTLWLLLGSFLSFSSFFLLRKISPELTSAANPPLSLQDWPWGNIHAHLPLLYMWDAYHGMAFANQCHVRTQDMNRRTPSPREAEGVNLTTAPLGQHI